MVQSESLRYRISVAIVAVCVFLFEVYGNLLFGGSDKIQLQVFKICLDWNQYHINHWKVKLTSLILYMRVLIFVSSILYHLGN